MTGTKGGFAVVLAHNMVLSYLVLWIMQYRIFQSQFKVYKPSDLTQERKQNKRRRPENKKHR